MVEPGRDEVRRSDFEECFVHAGAAGALDEIEKHLAGKPAPSILVADADVQHVSLAGADQHDAVACDVAADLDHAADITHTQTIAENSLAPRKLIGGALDGHH